jgi:hypothetical protein
MRISTVMVALVAVVLGGASLSAAEISRSQLVEIGLPGLNVMPRHQAAQVRGSGFAIASGSSHVLGGITILPAYLHMSGSSASGASLAIGLGTIAGGSSSVSIH